MLADLASDTPTDAVGPDLLGQGISLHREIQEGGERRAGGTGERGREGRGRGWCAMGGGDLHDKEQGGREECVRWCTHCAYSIIKLVLPTYVQLSRYTTLLPL